MKKDLYKTIEKMACEFDAKYGIYPNTIHISGEVLSKYIKDNSQAVFKSSVFQESDEISKIFGMDVIVDLFGKDKITVGYFGEPMYFEEGGSK